MGKLLKPSSTEQYVEKGYCHPIDVLTREEATVCLAHLERYESKIGQPIDGKHRHKPHLLFPWLHDLICHPRVLDAVEDVLGPNILCWGSSFFIKNQNTSPSHNFPKALLTNSLSSETILLL